MRIKVAKQVESDKTAPQNWLLWMSDYLLSSVQEWQNWRFTRSGAEYQGECCVVCGANNVLATYDGDSGFCAGTLCYTMVLKEIKVTI